MKRTVRGLAFAIAALGVVQSAVAADLDYLRGSEVFAPSFATYPNWSGFYVGAQVGYGNAQMDFSNSTASLVARLLRNSSLEDLARVSQWTVLGQVDSRDVSYGGFFGYNSQWENVILGVEANYNHTSLFGMSTDSLSRIVAPGDGFTYDVTVVSTASMRITDYGTLRGRAGYVMGRFLPYAMLGFAMGRVETLRSADVFGFFVPSGRIGPVTTFSKSLTVPRTVYAAGYAAGLGVDAELLPNVFVRGEVEWVQFANLPDMKTNFVTGRVAAGLKF